MNKDVYKHAAVLRRGEKAFGRLADKFDTEKPVAIMVDTGKHAYLWIGGESGPCYATLSGQKTLTKFAETILASVNSNKKSRS